MPDPVITIDAWDIVRAGLYLRAKTPVNKYSFPGNVVGVFQAGANIGSVYSYIIQDGDIYWMLYDMAGNPFYVKHVTGAFDVGAQINQIIEQKKAAYEQQKKDDMGPIAYYIEKFGKQILIAGVVTAIAVAVIKKKL